MISVLLTHYANNVLTSIIHILLVRGKKTNKFILTNTNKMTTLLTYFSLLDIYELSVQNFTVLAFAVTFSFAIFLNSRYIKLSKRHENLLIMYNNLVESPRISSNEDSTDELENQVVGLKRRCVSAEEKLESLLKDNKKYKNQIDNLETELKSITHNNESLNCKVSELNQELILKNTTIHSLEATINELRFLRDTLLKNIDELKKELETVKGLRNNKVDKLTCEIDELRSDLQSNISTITALQEENNKLQETDVDYIYYTVPGGNIHRFEDCIHIDKSPYIREVDIKGHELYSFLHRAGMVCTTCINQDDDENKVALYSTNGGKFLYTSIDLIPSKTGVNRQSVRTILLELDEYNTLQQYWPELIKSF